MKKSILIITIIFQTIICFGQVTESQKMYELGKLYKDFMFRNEPTKDRLIEIETDVPEGLFTATEFIIQTITTKNKLLTNKFLERPDDIVLKQIYIIRRINFNLGEEHQIDNNHLIDSLLNKDISVYELLDNYYGMLFVAVGNKNQPFNFSKIDLKLKEYNLKDETEKGILVLNAIHFCGTNIWGYMNVVNPPNTKKAYKYIKKFPKINGSPYYQYSDFYFPDFEMIIIKDQGMQSYKSYYLNKFYETLLSHLICLNAEGGSDEKINDLLLGSILRERNLYKYTKYKDTLESIFQEQKTE